MLTPMPVRKKEARGTPPGSHTGHLDGTVISVVVLSIRGKGRDGEIVMVKDG